MVSDECGKGDGCCENPACVAERNYTMQLDSLLSFIDIIVLKRIKAAKANTEIKATKDDVSSIIAMALMSSARFIDMMLKMNPPPDHLFKGIFAAINMLQDQANEMIAGSQNVVSMPAAGSNEIQH